MQIQEKIRWLISMTPSFSIEDVIRTKKVNEIKKDINYLEKLGYKIGVKLITEKSLHDFYHDIYKPFIKNKNNAKVFDIIKKYSGELEKKIIYFGHISLCDDLIGGAIYVHRNSEYIRAFKASKKINIKLKKGITMILDYLFFESASNIIGYNNLDFLVSGKDRNGYRYIGPSIGIALHKLEQGFYPYSFEGNKTIEISEPEINSETLIFDSLNENNQFTRALVYLPKEAEENIKLKFHIVEKQGLTLIFKYF